MDTAIQRLKNNKSDGSDGIPAELLKAAGSSFNRAFHLLLTKIWMEEEMPKEWNTSIICPIHKKGDRKACSNYRGISLLNIAYKIFASIVCERLKPHVIRIIGPYQCGFMPGKSTTDQIFTLRHSGRFGFWLRRTWVNKNARDLKDCEMQNTKWLLLLTTKPIAKAAEENMFKSGGV